MLTLPIRQERYCVPCSNDGRLVPPRPTPEGWLRLARPPRVGSALPDPRGQALPRPTPEVWLRLARCPGAGFALPDVRGWAPPHPISMSYTFIRMSTGYDMTFESNAAPRTMPCAMAGKVPPGYDGMGALDHSGIAESEQYCRHRLRPSDTEPDIDIRQPLWSRKGLVPSTMMDVLSPRCSLKGVVPALRIPQAHQIKALTLASGHPLRSEGLAHSATSDSDLTSLRLGFIRTRRRAEQG